MFRNLLKVLAQTFERAGIPYMVIGGQATLIYGEPRLTQDVDVTLGVGPERLPEVLEAAKSAGWRVLVEKPQAFVEETMVLPCAESSSSIRLDLVFSISEYEKTALSRTRAIDVDGVPVRFTSPEDLIVHKVVAGRPRDLDDVKSVLIKMRELERSYIVTWLEHFESALAQPFLQRFLDIEDSIR